MRHKKGELTLEYSTGQAKELLWGSVSSCAAEIIMLVSEEVWKWKDSLYLLTLYKVLAEWALVSDSCIKAVRSCVFFEKSGFYIPPNRLSLDPKGVYLQSDAALGTPTSLHFGQSSLLTGPRFLPDSLVSSSRRFSHTICPLRSRSWKIIRLIVFKTHYAFHICCTQSTGLEDIYTN